MINTLTGAQGRTSTGPRGTTLGTTLYHTEHEGQKYVFVDTAGLDEAQGGTVNRKEAINNLLELLIHAKEGFNLLVFVFKKDKILSNNVDNYDFFVHLVASDSVPVVCVVTGCEVFEPPGVWVDKNEKHFRDSGITPAKFVGTCFLQPGTEDAAKQYLDFCEPLRMQSARDVWETIQAHTTEEPVNLVEAAGGFWTWVRNVWNGLCRWLGHIIPPARAWMLIAKEVVDLFMRLGFSETEAHNWALKFEQQQK